MTVLGIAAVGTGLAVDPCLQVIADRTDPHCDPVTIFCSNFWRACACNLQCIDAASRVVAVPMVKLRLIAGRIFLFLIDVRCAAEIDPTVSSPTSGIADAGFRIEFKVVELLDRGKIPLSSVAGEDTIDHFPLGLVLELVLSPAIKIATIEQLDPTSVWSIIKSRITFYWFKRYALN